MSAHRPNSEWEAIELIRSLDVCAREELHQRTAVLVATRSSRRPRRIPAAAGPYPRLHPRLGGALGLAATAAIALAAILAPGGGSPLSAREAAALTFRAATAGAPSESEQQRSQLTAAVDGIAFPYWEERFGWRASGTRSDRLGGGLVRTVFYTDNRGQRIGYAIVSRRPAPRLDGGAVRWLRGTPYRLLVESGGRVVAWLRDGHLCVVGGRGIGEADLLRLASWEERDSAPV